MTTTVVVSAVCGGLAGYLTTYLRIRYEIARNRRAGDIKVKSAAWKGRR